MKYKFLLLPIAGMFIIAAIFVSCSKQDQTELNSSSPEISQSKADILIENKIRAFKGKLEHLRENPQFKSGETIEVDSAVWYIEAASNQTYGDAGTPFGELVIDSFNIDVPASNGEIQLNDILVAYDEMINGLSDSYNAIPDENKHLVLNDVSLKSEDAGTATFGITAGFGVEGDDGTSGIFNDPWWWGLLKGKCDDTYVGTDAAEQIEHKIHMRRGVPSGHAYYTDVDSVEVIPEEFPNPNDPTPWNNMYDYMMFENIDNGIMPNVHGCLSVEEMYFYLYGTESVIYNYPPDGARPEGKHFISVNLIGDAVYPTWGTVLLHRAVIKYGVLHQNSEPPIDL